jgi:hypothetical protein
MVASQEEEFPHILCQLQIKAMARYREEIFVAFTVSADRYQEQCQSGGFWLRQYV